MADVRPTVFVVDDDCAARESVRRLMDTAGLPVKTYADAKTFLTEHDPSRPGCLILDIRMRRTDGVALQKYLATKGVTIPVIIVAAQGDAPTPPRAPNPHVVEFVTAPYKGGVLLDCVRHAIDLDRRIRTAPSAQSRAATVSGKHLEMPQ